MYSLSLDASEMFSTVDGGTLEECLVNSGIPDGFPVDSGVLGNYQ
jgi:hypothetical protein